MKINIKTSPILDYLIKKLSLVSIDEEIQITSNFRTQFGGPSWDFAGYREYTQNDDASKIDWKASIRSKKILVKEYNELQALNVLFLLDASESMMLGTTGKRKFDFASEVIGTLAYSILKAKGKVSLSLFQESLGKLILTINDISQFNEILRKLTETSTKGKANFKLVSKMITPHLKKGTLLILVSDFLNLGENWKENIIFLNSRVKLIGFMIRDPIDRSLPKGIDKVYIQEPGTERKIVLNVRKYRKEYEIKAKEQELEVQNLFGNFLLLNTDENYLPKLIDFLQRGYEKFH